MTTASREWSIQQVAREAGTTSRTLRHYDAIGLLAPSRIGANRYRFYDEASLLRLQRILLLRELGLGLPAIAEALDGREPPAATLRTHLELLEMERARIGRQVASVRATLDRIEGGEPLMATEMFDGFDHTCYRDEVIDRWGKEAYERGDTWWRSLTEDDKHRFGRTQLQIAADFAKAMKAGLRPDDEEAQALAQRQYEWITAAWQGRAPTAEAFNGLGEMYVADPRFTEAYDAHGTGTAAFVRDTMKTYATRNLP